MINLFDYYKNNIKKDDYYYRFYNFILTEPERRKQEIEFLFGSVDFEDEENLFFEIYDEEEAIEKFKKLCDPDIIFDNQNKSLFFLVCYFLKNCGYQIEEFPRILARPPEDPTAFTIKEIRNRAFSLKLDNDGTVKYKIRRKIVEDLNFKKSFENKVYEELNLKFQEISTRNARFENMSTDEKIKEIINLIENLLKKDGKYIKINFESITFNLISDKSIIDFKKKIQCFRHSSEESLNERKQFNEKQKQFIIDYGIMICNLIYYNK